MHYILISTGNPDNNSIGLKVSFVSTMLSPNYFQLGSIMTQRWMFVVITNQCPAISVWYVFFPMRGESKWRDKLPGGVGQKVVPNFRLYGGVSN